MLKILIVCCILFSSFSRIANEPNKQALVVSPHQTTSKMPFISRQCFPEIQKPSSWLEVVSDSRVYTTVSDPIVETSLELSTATKNHPRSQEIYVEPTSNNAPSLEEFQQTFSSTTTSVSRPSSSYSNQSQQSIGHEKGKVHSSMSCYVFRKIYVVSIIHITIH